MVGRSEGKEREEGRKRDIARMVQERDEAVHPVYDGRKIFVEASLRNLANQPIILDTVQVVDWLGD